MFRILAFLVISALSDQPSSSDQGGCVSQDKEFQCYLRASRAGQNSRVPPSPTIALVSVCALVCYTHLGNLPSGCLCSMKVQTDKATDNANSWAETARHKNHLEK